MSDLPNPGGLCMCGCGGATNRAGYSKTARGWVKGEHVRYISGHNSRKGPDGFIENPETGCWEWQGYKNRKGYGMKRVGAEVGYAHRIYYERACGPIPDGLELDHLCRNPSCVNPDHLEPVTHAENMRRGSGTRLSASDIPVIRSRYLTEDITYEVLGAEYGVAKTTIKDAVVGRNWSCIPGEPEDDGTGYHEMKQEHDRPRLLLGGA